MIYDTDFLNRIELLIDLMQKEPRKPMKKLQWEALKFYPLHYTASIRHWMSWKIAAYAADILNQREGLYENFRRNG